MERIKVHTFHSNGNDIVCKQMTAERVNKHILYISEDETYSNWSIYSWNQLETGTNIICSILHLIRKYNYNTLSTRTEKYIRNGELLKAPKTYYYIGLSKNSLCYQIPAKLGKILTLKENKQ